MSTGRLHGKVAVVTGGASSIGRAISLAYAREGAKIIVADLSETSRDASEADVSTHRLIAREGGEAWFEKLDVTDVEGGARVVRATVERFGRLDVWVNNAGIAHDVTNPKPIWEAKDEQWQKTMDVNVTGVFYGMRAATAHMVQQEPNANGDRGWVVNLASIFGLVANPWTLPYVTSKHAVMGLTKAAALDCAPLGIHVNAICPGWVQSSFSAEVLADQGVKDMATSMHPLRGLGRPDDIAPIAVLLASDDAKWMTGTGVTVDGGYTAR